MRQLFSRPVSGNLIRSWSQVKFLVWLIFMPCAFLLPGVSTGQTLNPLESDPRAAAVGGSLYRAQCATCHGADATGIQNIQAPDLTRLWLQPGRTDESVFLTIRNGIPGSIMPPHSFTETETWMLVSYLKSIGVGDGGASYRGSEGRGGRLFANNCSGCHRVSGTGGSLGPDLSRITSSRSRQSLTTAVRDPSATLARNYRPVTLVTSDGMQMRGTLKSEDAFSIQIMDSSQNLRGYRKSDLAAVRYDQRSLMPAFNRNALSDADLEDILSYLASQAGRSTN